jgi:drug/metabolite transporter (DMT)-like permease
VTPERIAFVLTALAAVVVVLTRVRMTSREEEAAGRVDIPRALVNVHTTFGVLALVLWGAFVLGQVDLISDVHKVYAYVGLGCWWITTVAGLLILMRWVPAHGRHASGPAVDSWGEGPGLSILGHVGLLVGSIVWTYLLIADKLT